MGEQSTTDDSDTGACAGADVPSVQPAEADSSIQQRARDDNAAPTGISSGPTPALSDDGPKKERATSPMLVVPMLKLPPHIFETPLAKVTPGSSLVAPRGTPTPDHKRTQKSTSFSVRTATATASTVKQPSKPQHSSSDKPDRETSPTNSPTQQPAVAVAAATTETSEVAAMPLEDLSGSPNADSTSKHQEVANEQDQSWGGFFLALSPAVSSFLASTPVQSSATWFGQSDKEDITDADGAQDAKEPFSPVQRAARLAGRTSAMCFVGGYLDLLSAVALSRIDVSMHRVLLPWLRQLEMAHVRVEDSGMRLLQAADVAVSLPRLAELFVGPYAMPMRWLRSSSVAARQILDLKALVAKIRNPTAAFAVAAVACRLARSGAMRRVVLNGCEVDLRGRKLDFGARSVPIDVTAAASICGVITGASTPQLRDLLLHQNKIGDAGAVALAAAIASGSLSLLKTLTLGENRIGPIGAAALANAMVPKRKKTTSATSQPWPLDALAKLSFDGNFLGDEGVAALAKPLAAGALPSLEVLGLNRNAIQDIGPLTEAISSGEAPSLRKLLIQHNRLGDRALRNLHDTIGAASGDTGPSAVDSDGIAVRLRGLYQPTHAKKPFPPSYQPTPEPYVPAVRRGFPQMRDAITQTAAAEHDNQSLETRPP